MKVPTKQLQEYSDRHSLNLSMVKLLQWLIRKSPGYGAPFTIDLNQFNKWQGKNRPKGLFCSAWLWKLQKKLITLSIIKVKNSWRGGILELSILPFDGLNYSAKNSQSSFTRVNNGRSTENAQNPVSDSDTANRNDGDGYKQQQHIDYEIDNQHLKATFAQLTKSGFKFDAKTVIKKIAIYSAEAIAKSIQYVRLKIAQRRHRPILNPNGYILDCLQKGYWREVDSGTEKGYWASAVSDLSSLISILKDKLEQVDIEAYTGKTCGEPKRLCADRLGQLIPLLEPGYISEQIIAEAIAWDEDLKLKKETRKTSRRRRGKGFGV